VAAPLIRRLALGGALIAALALPAAADAAPKAKVMTRNLYLGADLTPGVQATTLQGLVNAAGVILNEVDANKYPVRAKGLANEIKAKSPDLVGLQEASLWRTAPCTENPFPPKATKVRYDYVKRLLAELNKGQQRYRLVIVKPEFDFEIQANTDGNESTHAPGCGLGAELNVRLTMRDAILAKTGPNVQTSNAKSGTFDTLLQVRPVGVAINVTRGWNAVDAKVGQSKTFRFVNTHFEAFDSAKTGNHTNKGTDVNKGKVREAQALELSKAGGPATGSRVILVGDLNSDKNSVPAPGDKLAYKALLARGFFERSTSNPFGCCLNASLITANGGGKVSDFDHQVDHVMTNNPSKITLISSAVTGRQPVNGFWDSDHAGLFSALNVP
jgi:endonuclease/exonuclease/phosphatase family metal-dependent hydrolase